MAMTFMRQERRLMNKASDNSLIIAVLQGRHLFFCV